jgi:hypothetical protein
VTTPVPQDEADETPIQRFRTPLAAWVAFGEVCKRRDIARARRLFDLMWGDVKRYGTDRERQIFAVANRELQARRSRKRTPDA